MKKYGLTPQQEKIYSTISEYMEINNGVSPSVQEIMEHTGTKNPRAVSAALDQLEERGWIRRLKNKNRSIAIN